MSEAVTQTPYLVNSLIGEGSEFRGEFKINGLLRIDGYFKGVIETSGKVLVGETGVVDTDITSGIVIIGGRVNGNIHAKERVRLLSTCRLTGDIVTPALFLEEGAIFEGNCMINKHLTKEEMVENPY